MLTSEFREPETGDLIDVVYEETELILMSITVLGE